MAYAGLAIWQMTLDGYFLLMDWLEIPMLRSRSIGFIRTGLWARLRQASNDSGHPVQMFFSARFWRGLTRDERLYAGFGVLSVSWALVAIVLSVRYWQRQVSGSLMAMWSGGGVITRVVIVVAGLAVAALAAYALVSMARPYGLRLFRWLRQKGAFAGMWRVTAMMVGASVLLAFTPGLVLAPDAALGLAAVAVALGGLWAWQNDLYAKGALHDKAFGLLALFAAFSILAVLLAMAMRWGGRHGSAGSHAAGSGDIGWTSGALAGGSLPLAG